MTISPGYNLKLQFIIMMYIDITKWEFKQWKLQLCAYSPDVMLSPGISSSNPLYLLAWNSLSQELYIL